MLPRSRVLYWSFLILFAITVLTQIRVHFFEKDKILQYAQDTKRFNVKRIDPAKRGKIYSSDRRILAKSIDVFELGIQFQKVPKTDAFFLELALASQIPATEFKHWSLSNKQNCTWPQPIGTEVAHKIQQIKIKWRADGISLHRFKKRQYPLGPAISSIVGTLDQDKPNRGLELAYQKVLAGKNGFREGLIDRTGAFLPMRMGQKAVSVIHGKHIELTIDSHIQKVAYEAIRKGVQKHKAERGCAVVMDPRTGDILAAANYPSFDPIGIQNIEQKFSDFSPAVMATWEPGSTFKCLTLAKVLDEKIINKHDKINCLGEMKVGKSGRVRCDMHDGHRDHGWVNAEEAIARSCNLAAAQWMMKLSHPKMVQFLNDLGLLEKSDLKLPGDRKGLFNHNDYAKLLQHANVGFGQSLSCTPIALASAYSALGNKGLRMKPRLVKKIDGKEEKPKVAKQVFSVYAAETSLKSMELTIHSDIGTAYEFEVPGQRMAVKTGTAQRTNPETGKLQGGGYIPSFLGFLCPPNPKLMILVMLEKPTSGFYYGRAVAGPVFHEISQDLVRYYAFPPEPVLLEDYKLRRCSPKTKKTK